MDRRHFSRTGLIAGLAGLFAGSAAAADSKTDAGKSDSGKPHRLVIQVSTDDRKIQQTALGNAGNYAKYYKDKGEPYELEIVAFGPGYAMMRADVSMVKGNIESLQQSLGASITFSACQNSRHFAAESEGKTPDQIPQLPGIKDTPAGIVRVAVLQEQGWSYARP